MSAVAIKWRGTTIFKYLTRLWIPLLAVAVIAVTGFTVSRLHGIFGADTRATYADTTVIESTSFDPKKLTYEVFGPPGAVANISYFDADADPQFIKDISLPWVLEFEIGKTTAVGSVMAQGNADSIGCRITVDDEIKSEKSSNQVNAFASCLLKAA